MKDLKQPRKPQMKFEIKNRWDDGIKIVIKGPDFKTALLDAIKHGSDLRASNLSGCNLSYSNLGGCDLSGSDLSGSDLRASNLSYSNLGGCNLSGCDLGASNLRASDLRDSNLSGSDLSYSNLSGCNLSGSDLRASNLSGCNLNGCNLSGSNLRGSHLSGNDLRGSDLTPIRDDFWVVLDASAKEVPALRKALIEGRVDGSTYDGECACLIGTLANERKVKYSTIPGLPPDSSRPAEKFFFGIREGDTPRTNQFSKIAVKWIDQWDMNRQTAFNAKEECGE